MTELIGADTLAEAKEILEKAAYRDKDFIIDIPLSERGEEHGNDKEG